MSVDKILNETVKEYRKQVAQEILTKIIELDGPAHFIDGFKLVEWIKKKYEIE